jgi:hypothetical protein
MGHGDQGGSAGIRKARTNIRDSARCETQKPQGIVSSVAPEAGLQSVGKGPGPLLPDLPLLAQVAHKGFYHDSRELLRRVRNGESFRRVFLLSIPFCRLLSFIFALEFYALLLALCIVLFTMFIPFSKFAFVATWSSSSLRHR